MKSVMIAVSTFTILLLASANFGWGVDSHQYNSESAALAAGIEDKSGTLVAYQAAINSWPELRDASPATVSMERRVTDTVKSHPEACFWKSEANAGACLYVQDGATWLVSQAMYEGKDVGITMQVTL